MIQAVKVYDWEGNVVSYFFDGKQIPCAEGNGDYRTLTEKITAGECAAVEPEIAAVQKVETSEGALHGYRFGAVGFVPADERNALFRLIREAISRDSSIVKAEPQEDASEAALIERVVICVLFQAAWEYVRVEVPGTLPYQSHQNACPVDIQYRLINIYAADSEAGFGLLCSRFGVAGQLLPHDPRHCGAVLEISISARDLQKIYRNERAYLEALRDRSFLNSWVRQHLAEFQRESSGPQLVWLIHHAKLYLERVVINFTNAVLHAFSQRYAARIPVAIGLREYGADTLWLFRRKDDSHFAFALPYSRSHFNHGMSTYDDSPTHLDLRDNPKSVYEEAISRARLLLSVGLHAEALVVVNSYLEVLIRAILIQIAPAHTTVIDQLGHRQRLDILSKSVLAAHDEVVKITPAFHRAILLASGLYDARNNYIHGLELPHAPQFATANVSIGGRIMDILDRLEVERLIAPFCDVHLSSLWFSMLHRVASQTDHGILQAIDREIQKCQKS